ncbi:ATP-binding protein [Cellulomonas sp. ES6]|uniref:ATP-binding protein n=1 Tax=Cellulomonas sp. ES6 TaxID=3039384 RepID=UPI0024B66B15|nr:ATP-binding protein [Cellulomonas sp. ES6]WHP18854.1 ATP-binding protein [Cellulomonas sp. ES6]
MAEHRDHDRGVILAAPAVVSSVPRLRRWSLERARAAGAGIQALATIELAASEVITNAVRHAHNTGDITVRMRADATQVRFDVHDDDPTLPHLRANREGLPGGHGLHILGTITSGWGAYNTGAGGKAVWFTVPL